MKRTNKKLITLMLAGALCSATLGGMLAQGSMKSITSSAAEATAKITDVFEADKTNGGVITTKANGASEEDKTETLVFELADSNDKISMKRDLAYKWFAGKNDARYFNMTFAFEELSFESLSFVMECAPSVATEDEKTSNTVKFTKDADGKVWASVLNGDVEDTANKKEIVIAAGDDVKLSFKGAMESDAFAVVLYINGASYEIGDFTNVGANFADYSAEKISPLSVSATFAEGATDTLARVLLKDINGQAFTNITGEETKLITDTAAPVLVVNDDLNGFMLGTKIYESMSYVNIDVLQTSNITEKKEFYRYSPVDTEVTYTDITSSWSSTLVNYTTYYLNRQTGEVSKEAKDGFELTSVFLEEGAEYVSTKITLGDDAFKDADGEWSKVTYDLSWYAPAVDPTDDTRAIVVEKGGVDYIVVDRNTSGPSYKYIVANETKKENEYVNETEFNAQMAIFQAKLDEKAKGVYAGSGSYMYFPSMEWLFQDNNGYRGLRFVISYKTPTSQSPSSSAIKTYSSLSLSATSEGTYEFKIFASDKAGNPMYYYLDGELVEVTANNVWDIDEIPSFTYVIENLGIKVESSSSTSRKSTKILDETYTFSDPTIKGATNRKSEYALYKIDLSAYNDTLQNGEKELTTSMLSEVGYDQIAKKLEGKITIGADYFNLYTMAISEVLADKVNGDATAIQAIFGEAIGEYNDKITEDDAEWEWNKYEWRPSSKSFKTVEEGTYMVIADYWERDLPMQRAAAYKVVIVASEADVIKGETQWLKDNVISVVLFAIAGVMLVLIIILLLIKPSDETLEDLDKKPAKKAKKTDKKSK